MDIDLCHVYLQWVCNAPAERHSIECLARNYRNFISVKTINFISTRKYLKLLLDFHGVATVDGCGIDFMLPFLAKCFHVSRLWTSIRSGPACDLLEIKLGIWRTSDNTFCVTTYFVFLQLIKIYLI